jgi:hypothetical protein
MSDKALRPRRFECGASQKRPRFKGRAVLRQLDD